MRGFWMTPSSAGVIPANLIRDGLHQFLDRLILYEYVIAFDLPLNFSFVLIEEVRQGHRPRVVRRWITAQVLLITTETRAAGRAARAAI